MLIGWLLPADLRATTPQITTPIGVLKKVTEVNHIKIKLKTNR